MLVFIAIVMVVLRGISRPSQAISVKHKRKFCCNLFADESSMVWGKHKQNIYIAREVLSMQPLLDNDNTYLKFIERNSWALKHFNNYEMTFPKEYPSRNLYRSPFIDLVDNLLCKFQLNYMKKKKTTEITTKHFIHFNKHDHSKEILREYKRNLSSI